MMMNFLTQLGRALVPSAYRIVSIRFFVTNRAGDAVTRAGHPRYPIRNSKRDDQAMEKSETAPSLAIAVPLTNRKPDGSFAFPADNWYLIAPFGDHPHEGSGFVQVIDPTATDAMASAFKTGDELLVDFEHESHNPDKRTTASGWIQDLRTGAAGLEAQIRWTGSGKESLANGDYRFISPVWLAKDCAMVDGTENKIRPMRLNDAGLTNTPNLKGLKPLSNRQLKAAVGQRDAGLSNNEEKEQPKMKKVLQALGLSADANEESAITALTELQNSSNKVPDLEKQITTLTNSNRELLNSTVENDLNTAGLEGEERETWKGQLLANRTGALPLLASLVKTRGNAQAATLTNRQTTKTPADKGKQQQKSKRQQIDEAVANAKGKTFDERFENAKRENADLFKPEEANAA